jgi:hypothetical protein
MFLILRIMVVVQCIVIYQSPLHAHTALPLASTVQDPSFRQGLGEQGLTEIV